MDVLPDEGGRRELLELDGFGVGLVGAAEEDFGIWPLVIASSVP